MKTNSIRAGRQRRLTILIKEYSLKIAKCLQ
jgi:hypothetical protein